MKYLLSIVILLAMVATTQAEFTETMDPNEPTKNLITDFGMVDDNAKNNQRKTLQTAIDAVSAEGGGILRLPKGIYRFSGIAMKSNVHLMIEKDTVIKPWWPEGEKVVVFSLDGGGRRGGVTFRLETGAGGHYGGIHNITAKNIYCEDGSTAVLMGPHKSQNGVVKIDGVTAKSCAWAVTMGPGFVEEKNKDDKEFRPGIFAEGTTVKNVHAIFGTNAAVSLKGLVDVPKKYLKDLRLDENDRKMKRVRGPSVGVVRDSTEGSWNAIIENVTSEGFKYNKGVTKGSKEDRVNWKDLLEGTPLREQLEKTMSKSRESGPKAMTGKNRHG